MIFWGAKLVLTPKIYYPEWSGSVGVTLGFFSGTALIYSPLTFVYFSRHASEALYGMTTNNYILYS